MQDLVGIGVADSREDVGIGEGTLERVTLTGDRGLELVDGHLERLETSWVERSDRGLALDDGERGALLRRGFGQHERAAREVKRRESDLALERRAALLPAQPSGDHQVENEEEIAFESNDDALAHSTHVAHAPAFGGFGRRLEGPQQVEP